MPPPGTGFEIAKLDDEQRLVFGWANVSIAKDGALLTDSQDDQIEPEDLEKAAYDFVLECREAGEMHRGVAKGTLVESVIFTAEKIEKMGFPANAALHGRWWVGFKVEPDVFAKVKTRELKMFSIQGKGTRVPVAA